MSSLIVALYVSQFEIPTPHLIFTSSISVNDCAANTAAADKSPGVAPHPAIYTLLFCFNPLSSFIINFIALVRFNAHVKTPLYFAFMKRFTTLGINSFGKFGSATKIPSYLFFNFMISPMGSFESLAFPRS